MNPDIKFTEREENGQWELEASYQGRIHKIGFNWKPEKWEREQFRELLARELERGQR